MTEMYNNGNKLYFCLGSQSLKINPNPKLIFLFFGAL